MLIRPLIDADDIVQSGLGGFVAALPVGRRTMDGMKGVVVRVYPVGHPENRLGQPLADVQPLSDIPALLRVPICLPHAHQETEEALEWTNRRQPYAPKARNRMEGSSRDLRPGTHVWVQFLGGSLHDPVIVQTMQYSEQGAGGFPMEQQVVDRIQDDGSVIDAETHPLSAAIDHSDPDHVTSSYPRSADVYNGVRVEVDNTGSRYVQTSTDREPVFPGHNGIPGAPAPRGNYGVSTRGAVVGNQVFTSGRHPRFPDEESVGRQGRRTIDADDGTIRDETRGSKKGSLIQRIASRVGRFFVSTRGSGDGAVYLENAQRHYLSLSEDAVELHGAKVILDGDKIYLGSGEVLSELVTHPQLKTLLAQLWRGIDQHRHLNVQPGSGITGVPELAVFEQTWNGGADTCKAAGVFAEPTHAASPEPQDDPDA